MVELRSRTHLNSHVHYIRAIKDGSIKIVLNSDPRGKSKLKFRQLVDVYDSKDDESVVPIVVRDLEDVPDMTQGSCLFGAEVDTKTDPEDFTMTLEKIRKQCKEKKRKLRDTETASKFEVKKEYLAQDEGCDFEEPLISWDTKYSKRRKKKQELKAKCSSSSSPSVEKVDLPLISEVKNEAWDDSYPVSQAKDSIPTDLLLDSNNESESPIKTVLEEEIMHDSSKDMSLPLYCNEEPIKPVEKAFEEPNSPGMVAIEEPIKPVGKAFEEPNSPGIVAIEEPMKPVEKAFEDASEEFNDATKAQCCLDDDVALENKEIILYCSVSREDMEVDVLQHSESANIDSFKARWWREGNKKDEESNDLKRNLDMTISGLENVETQVLEILAIDYSSLSLKDFGIDCSEFVWDNEDIAKDDLPEATDILQLTNCCNSLDDMQPVPETSTFSLEKDQLPERLQQSSPSKDEDEERDHRLSQVYKAPDEVEETAAETDSIQQQKLHHQPEKLLSGRKALSPTSQAKLCKEMEHPDSPEKRSKKSKGKLYFSSQNSHRILKAQGLDNIDRVEIIPSSKQAIQKANNSTRQTQNQRAKHKFPRRDTRAAKGQPFSTGRTSMQECSQKAIAFSQGQMHDFRHVASKLTKELKMMRLLAKRCLLAESNTSNISDCNLDEVHTLIRNSEKTEESSKKWLSMIQRDCNRFCKLMGMVKEDSPATENIVQKKRKIKFADDAGGDLCHVKFFETDLESES